MRILNFFSAKANTYNKNAKIQKEIVDFTIDLLKKNTVSSDELWLDLGSGTGFVKKTLQEKLDEINIIETDIAFSKNLDMCFDFDNLPLKNNSIDKIISCSALQWSKNIEILFANLHKILKNDGESYLVFSIFETGTLQNLQIQQKKYSIFSQVKYYDKNYINNLLRNLGFKITAFEQKTFSESFDTAKEAIKSISQIGATSHAGNMLSPKKLLEFIQDYALSFDNGKIIHDYKTLFYIAEKK